MAVGAFEDRLHSEEASEILKVRSNETTEFLEKHFVGMLKALGIDASDLL
jgi:hypothetical protein